LIPHNRSTWLTASMMECIPSDTIDELPVKAAAVNFDAAIIKSTAKEM